MVEIQELSRCFFVDALDHNIFRRPYEYDSSLCGYDKNGYWKITDPIKEVIGTEIKTKDGWIYVLKDMDPDYKEYADAIENKVPIIDSWLIKGDLQDGYFMTGQDQNGDFVCGNIISHERNFITLDNEIRYFVLWRNYSTLSKEISFMTGKYLDMCIDEDFESCAGIMCRPKKLVK